jgi:hypothetical protein
VELLDAYFAGLIDGEGTITLLHSHRTKTRTPVVSLTTTTPELVLLLQQRYGGHIRRQKTYSPSHRPAFVWSVRYDAALSMLRLIRPHLVVHEKRRRADLLLDRYKAVTPRNGKYDAQRLEAKLAFEQEFFHPSAP